MLTWVIVSWVFVGILTIINIIVFLKLKQASEQMMKMAFPGARNMGEAVAQMQKMMNSMNRGGRPGFPPGAMWGRNMESQLKAAMDMLQNMQKGKR